MFVHVCADLLALGYRCLWNNNPLPCNPEAETALQPLIWHFEGLSFRVKYFLEECFLLSQTPVVHATRNRQARRPRLFWLAASRPTLRV